MKTDPQKADKIQFLKRECSQQKSRLMDIERKLRELDLKEADKLGRIIGRLEDWQNK